LAAPARRNDKRDARARRTTTTPKSRGKDYTPKKYRGGENRTGRQQSYLASAIPRPKDIIPGSSDLKQLSRGITEGQSYPLNEEENIFQATSEVKNLISDLEKAQIQIDENETQQKA